VFCTMLSLAFGAAAALLVQHGGLVLNSPQLRPSTRSRLFMADAAADAKDGSACIRLEDKELPDCVDTDAPGNWYRCDEPPVEDGSLQCFQPEDMPGCEDGAAASGAEHSKSWICVDQSTLSKDAESEDSY